MSRETGRSPWFYGLLGCLGCLGLVALVVGGLAFLTFRTARQVTADNEDPERRMVRALEVLGAERAPGGYHAAAVVSIPFLVQMAIFTDLPPEESARSGEFREEGFFYLRLRGGGDDLRAFFDGEAGDSGTFRDLGIELDIDENLGRGNFDRGDFTARWATFRGRASYEGGEPDPVSRAARGGVRVDGSEQPPGEIGELVTLIEFDCPEDEWMRVGVWFGPASSSGTGEVTLEAGTADPAADGARVEAFLQPVHPCGRSA